MNARAVAMAMLAVIVFGGHNHLASAIDNCCFVNRQCATDAEWVAGYHAFQRNECPVSQPAALVSAPVSAPAGQPVNNCCNVNWQCGTKPEWDAGYFAYQRNECADIPAISVPAPVSSTAGQPIDNCCFVNRQCATDQEWVDGYAAFQDDRSCGDAASAAVPGQSVSLETFDCHSIPLAGPVNIEGPVGSHPIPIAGPEDFSRKLRAALDLLKRKAGGWHWYGYVTSGISSIQATEELRVWIDSQTGKVSWTNYHYYFKVADLAAIIGTLAHEACHVHRKDSSQLEEEIECTRIGIRAVDAICPNHPARKSWQHLVDNLRSDPDLRWWGRD